MEDSRAGESAPVTLRPVTPNDEAFLYTVYSTTRAEELALVSWNETQREAFLKMQFSAQQAHYQKHYSDSTHDIILAGADAVGRLYVARRESDIQILDITILPEHRSQGIGTPLIRELMTEASRAGKAVNIYVESFNPSHRLFERLGFVTVEDDGVIHLMEWRDESPRSKVQSPKSDGSV